MVAFIIGAIIGLLVGMIFGWKIKAYLVRQADKLEEELKKNLDNAAKKL